VKKTTTKAPAKKAAPVAKKAAAAAKKAAPAAKKAAPAAGTKARNSTRKSATSKTTGTTTRTTATKSSARKTPARTAPTRTAPARKTPATTPEKKVAVKSSSANLTEVTAEVPAGTSAAKKPAPKSSTKSAKSLTVGAGESPWTAAELADLRGELEHEVEHLREEIHDAEEEIAGLLRDGGDGAGNDQADVGSTTFERDHEMSLANNARDMLMQTERALARIDDGTYGVCESCGNPIGKGRLQAFPRATLCVSCKEREERR